MKKKLSIRAWLQFFTCGVGGFAIFYVLFCRASFYEAFIEAMNVTNTQFGVMYSVYGWIAVAGYIVGGVIADKLAPKYMMFLSFIGTGICNFLLGFWPSYGLCLTLYAIMGVTTTVTFWAAMLKCNRIFGRNIGDENRAFSWLETCRGVAEILISTLIVFLFSRFANIVLGLRFVLWCYAGLLIVLGVLSLFIFDGGHEKAKSGQKTLGEAKDATGEAILTKENSIHQVLRLLKNPDMWLAVLVAFGGYNIGSCIGSYLGDIAGGVFGASVVLVAYIGTINAWFKPLGAFIGSFVTRKKGPSFILEWTTWIYMVLLVIFLVMPKEPKYLIFFVVLLAIEIMCTGAFRSQKFIQIREAGIPMEDTGSAFGIISTLIYTSDAFMPVFIGMWLDSSDAVTAYNKLYYWLLASGVLTLAAVTVWRHRHKARIKLMIAEESAKTVARKAGTAE
ncbi:MAG: MFS transporter [Oscillospiraceae bacterium]|nr:MFS transporter [Oscillospiraceae bacterium]